MTFDQAFVDVMRGCAEPRDGQDGTWITDAMVDAYSALAALGYAHSVEAWADGVLAGGLLWPSGACSLVNRCLRGARMRRK